MVASSHSQFHQKRETFKITCTITALIPPLNGTLIHAPIYPKGTLIQKSSSLSFGEGRGEEAVKAPFRGGTLGMDVLGQVILEILQNKN